MSKFFADESVDENISPPTAWRFAVLLALAAGLLLWLSGGVFHFEPEESIWLQLRVLLIVPLVATHFVMFLAPGVFLLLLFRRRPIAPANYVMACIVLNALVGYAAFWAYFLDNRLGGCFSIAVVFVSLWGLIWRWRGPGWPRDSLRSLLSLPDVHSPLALMFLAALFYVAFLWFVPGTDNVLLTRNRFHRLFADDNLLPYFFAEKLFFGHDLRPFVREWLSSDRPPLQAGLVLVQRPLSAFVEFPCYQIVGTICQCVWVPAVWALCRTMAVSPRRTGLVILLCALSGFFLVNSVYVWPKLLPGGLVVWALAILLQPLREGKKPALGTAAFAALAAALGYLAHGGVVFTLIAMAVLFLLPRYFPGLRQSLLAFAVFATTVLPWSLYQKFYDPPANRLLKWHLAGVAAIDDRTTWQALKDEYGSLSASQIVIYKLDNVITFFPNTRAIDDLESWQLAESYNLFASLGALNLGWLLLIMTFMRPRWTAADADRPAARLLLCVGLLGTLVWVLLMFGGNWGARSTVIHQGSYATMILLNVGLSLIVLTLPRWAVVCVFMVQAIDFLVVWVLTTPTALSVHERLHHANLPMILISLLAFAAIVAIVIRSDGKFAAAPRQWVATPDHYFAPPLLVFAPRPYTGGIWRWARRQPTAASAHAKASVAKRPNRLADVPCKDRPRHFVEGAASRAKRRIVSAVRGTEMSFPSFSVLAS